MFQRAVFQRDRPCGCIDIYRWLEMAPGIFTTRADISRCMEHAKAVDTEPIHPDQSEQVPASPQETENKPPPL